MTLRFTPKALRELDDVLRYISRHSPNGAKRVKRRFEATFDLLLQNPEIGRRTSNARLRRIATTPYPYLVFYEANLPDIIVIAVRHAARDPASMPGG